MYWDSRAAPARNQVGAYDEGQAQRLDGQSGQQKSYLRGRSGEQDQRRNREQPPRQQQAESQPAHENYQSIIATALPTAARGGMGQADGTAPDLPLTAVMHTAAS